VENARRRWFVLRTGRKRNQVVEALRAKGVEVFVPTAEEYRRWSDRMKFETSPIFGAYIFCRFSPEERRLVLETTGLSPECGQLIRDVGLSDSEIESLRRLAGKPT
jgi:hypothetical protein